MDISDIKVERLAGFTDDDAIELGRLMPFLSDKFTAVSISRELLEEIVRSPYHDQLIARVEGRIVGAATLSIVMGAGAGREGYLQDFVTHPQFRGQGIGDAIWNEIMAWCQEHDVDLGFTSHPRRQDAHRFYLSHGAQIRETTAFRMITER